jgi:hypothetical protein
MFLRLREFARLARALGVAALEHAIQPQDIRTYEIVIQGLGAIESVRMVVLYASDVYLDLKTEVGKSICDGDGRFAKFKQT